MSPYLPVDKAVERKSSLCASLGSFGIMAALCLGVMLALLHQPEIFSAGQAKITMILRQAPPPEERQPVPDPEKRYRLLSQVKTPDNPVVPEYLPEPPKPEPKPLPKEPPPPPRRVKPVRQPVKVAPPAEEVAPAADVQESLAAAPGRENEVLAELLRAVEARKHYPKQARRVGAEGVAVLRVSVDQGRIRACSLGKASGNGILDRATQQLGERLVGLELPSAKGQQMVVSVPIHYVLK